MMRSKRTLLAMASLTATFLISSLSAAPASADTVIAGDLDFTIPVDSSADAGGGFAVRLGNQFHVPLLVVTPELAFSYGGFSAAQSPKVYRGLGGLRLGVGEIFRPGAYAHFGVGRLEVEAPGFGSSHTAFTYDLGASLDFTLLPILDLGAHAAYNRLLDTDDGASVKWATIGAHAALVF